MHNTTIIIKNIVKKTAAIGVAGIVGLGALTACSDTTPTPGGQGSENPEFMLSQPVTVQGLEGIVDDDRYWVAQDSRVPLAGHHLPWLPRQPVVGRGPGRAGCLRCGLTSPLACDERIDDPEGHRQLRSLAKSPPATSWRALRLSGPELSR